MSAELISSPPLPCQLTVASEDRLSSSRTRDCRVKVKTHVEGSAERHPCKAHQQCSLGATLCADTPCLSSPTWLSTPNRHV
ncbi:hypothetical protein DPEC_G00308760 [Dallia pectoralis]|uniref:Uncharacterized protein n=1 Tax=Dallia pectoralis TaxID=75939 RepID=A0ACC2FF12_DALPE|nr:hypothetical protein DPEC_G00308760 [Dallia pectoralis]